MLLSLKLNWSIKTYDNQQKKKQINDFHNYFILIFAKQLVFKHHLFISAGYVQPVASDQPPSYQPLAQPLAPLAEPSAPAYQPTGYQPPPTNGGYYDWNKPPQPN